MTKPLRFTFDTVFTSSDSVHENRPEDITYSKDEMNAAREEGYASGMEAARELAEQHMVTALEALLEQSGRLQADMERQFKTHQAEAGELALEITRKLTPAIIKRLPLTETEAMLNECLAHLNAPPHLNIHIAPELADDLRSRITGLAGAQGYAGQINVLAAPGMGLGDSRIEWGDGSVSRDSEELSNKIEAAIHCHLDALTGPERAKGEAA